MRALPRPVATVLAGLLAAVLLTSSPAPAPAQAPAQAAAQAPAQAADTARAAAPAARASTPNVVTPGDFTGYGFDQCLAPEQWKMDRWLDSSPYLAIGIYISGASRACREQRNLTPTWVSTQLAKGWRLLPITLGPQASCSTRFPRYGNDPTIRATPGTNGTYAAARGQGTLEADRAVAAAKALGISAGSTLWYDLENFDAGNVACRESALSFLSSWTTRLHALGYKSGVYSGASSGIKALDDVRAKRPGAFVLPDFIWIARWDHVANTSTSYIPETGWRPGGRVKQYAGDVKETWGGVTINVDRNFLDLGRGSRPGRSIPACGGVPVDFPAYPAIAPGAPRSAEIRALQCLFKLKGLYSGRPTGRYNLRTRRAVHAFESARRMPLTTGWGATQWMRLHAEGVQPVLKFGSTGSAVRRLQRTLNASGVARLSINGHYDTSVDRAVRAWQRKVRLPVTGVVAADSWRLLQAGRR